MSGLCSKNEYTKSESNSQLPQFIENILYRLCSKNEYTKSESNSQHMRIYSDWFLNCVQRTNIQNLKAIHNVPLYCIDMIQLCSKNEYTKSESNSQRFSYCVASAIYCVQRTNIQNLKAIHNQSFFFVLRFQIVFKERIYKI